MRNNKRYNNKGFTLAELLIVVAIIAVLVLIAIPVFSSSLEKSKEATDLANIRSTYSEVLTGAIADGTNDVVTSNPVALKQGKSEWQSTNAALAKLGTEVGTPTPGGYVIVEYHPEETEKIKTVVFRYTDGAGNTQQNPYAALAKKSLGTAVATQKEYIGSYCALANDENSAKYNQFVDSLVEQLGLSQDEMYFDYNPNAAGGVHRLRYTDTKIELSEKSSWTYVPNDTVFTVVDMDKDGNILKIYTNTVSATNKTQIGPISGGTTKALWDHPSNYVLVYDSSDPDAVLPNS